jgi:hypothetical protein
MDLINLKFLQYVGDHLYFKSQCIMDSSLKDNVTCLLAFPESQRRFSDSPGPSECL